MYYLYVIKLRNRLKRSLSLTGFTLVEVVCATVIVGMGLVAVAMMFQLGARSDITHQQNVVALNLLQKKMDSIIVKDYDNITSEAMAPDTDFPAYNLTVEVTNTSTTLKKVITTVSWTDAYKKERGETIATYRANRVSQ